VDLSDDPHRGVYDDERRPLRRVQRKRLIAIGHLDASSLDLSIPRGDVELQSQLELGRDAIRRRLRLARVHGEGAFFPSDVDVELGVSWLVKPLLEETSQRPAAHALHGALKIPRFDEPSRVRRQIEMDPLPKEHVTELRAERVEHETALLVEVTVE
jgi:hypothetical protein